MQQLTSDDNYNYNNNNNTNTNNQTWLLSMLMSHTTNSPSILWTFITILFSLMVIGCLANLILILCILRFKKTKANEEREHFITFLRLCACLSLVDLVSSLVACPLELITLAQLDGHRWLFPDNLCSIFRGLESFTAFVSICILFLIFIQVSLDKNDTGFFYKAAFMLSSAISISLIEFTFASIIRPHYGQPVCTLIDRDARFKLAAVYLFRFIPLSFILYGTILSAYRRFYLPANSPDGDTTKIPSYRSQELSIVITLSLTYIAFSLNRSLMSFLYLRQPPQSGEPYHLPPLADIAGHPMITLCLAFGHYALTALRPLCILLPSHHLRKTGQACCPYA